MQEPSPGIAAYLHWLHGGCMHFGSCSFGLKGSACTRPLSYALQMKPVVEGGEGFYRSFGLNTVKHHILHPTLLSLCVSRSHLIHMGVFTDSQEVVKNHPREIAD